MASTKTSSPSKFEIQVTDMISGFTNDLPSSVKNLLIGGASMTPSQILAQLNAIETTLSAVTTAKTAYTENVAARKAAMPNDRTFLENVVQALKGLFGASPTQLAAFGITPPKARTKPTAAATTIAKAKAAATRALRGTKGKKQKAAITLAGQSTVQVLGPDGQPIDPSASSASTSSSAPATPAAPAAPAAAPVAPAPAGH